MNQNQSKKYDLFLRIQKFLEEYSAKIAITAPAINAIKTEYNALVAELEQHMADNFDDARPAVINKNILKASCFTGIWKLISAMQFHFKITNNEIEGNNVKISESGLRKLPEKEFYSFCQMIMNLYEPVVFTPYGIVDAEVDALKLKLLNFPNDMQATEEAWLRRKLAGARYNAVEKKLIELLNTRLDPLMNVLKPTLEFEYLHYRNLRHIGLVNFNTGNPHFEGRLEPGQMILLAKKAFRRKRAIMVTNTGNSALQAGIGLNDSEMHGTPFTILPGKSSKRISQKLAVDGEYFLLQNAGEEETQYKVWLKE